MPKDASSDRVLDIMETLLRAQLGAIEDLRRSKVKGPAPRPVAVNEKSKYVSQTKMAYQVLFDVGQPLHINEIVSRINDIYGVSVTRDALVSALVKKVAQHKEFVKTDKNTYGLLGRDEQV